MYLIFISCSACASCHGTAQSYDAPLVQSGQLVKNKWVPLNEELTMTWYVELELGLFHAILRLYLGTALGSKTSRLARRSASVVPSAPTTLSNLLLDGPTTRPGGILTTPSRRRRRLVRTRRLCLPFLHGKSFSGDVTPRPRILIRWRSSWRILP